MSRHNITTRGFSSLPRHNHNHAPALWPNDPSLLTSTIPSNLHGLLIPTPTLIATFTIPQLLPLSPRLTHQDILTHIINLVSKGRILRQNISGLGGSAPTGAYEVNREWIRAQLELEQDDGDERTMMKKILFTVQDWDVGPVTPLITWSKSVVLKGQGFYFYVVKSKEKEKEKEMDKGKGNDSISNSKTTIPLTQTSVSVNWTDMRDRSSQTSTTVRGASKPFISTQQRSSSLPPYTTSQQTPVTMPTPTPTSPSQGLTILLSPLNLPLATHHLTLLNPHLYPSTIKASLQSHTLAGHMSRLDIDSWVCDMSWLSKKLSSEEGKREVGYGVDRTPVRAQGAYPAHMLGEIALDGVLNTRGREFVVLGMLDRGKLL